MKTNSDIIVVHAEQILTMNPQQNPRDDTDPDLVAMGVVDDGAIAIGNGRILAVGPTHEILNAFKSEKIIDATGTVISPGFVDCHTHSVFAGSRHMEFGMRMRGASYQEILKAGGGIHATVKATRAASLDELVALALPRLKASLAFGVTTMEVKSGYGLDVDTEIKMLKAVERLSKLQKVRLTPTYLGAHVVPLNYKNKRNNYVELMISEIIPEVAKQGLAEACDVFLEEGAFTLKEAEQILRAGREADLAPKIHAGQFTDMGGPELVAELKGLSADHLEQVSDRGLKAMAESGVVATLLPGAAFSLNDPFPNGRRIIDSGVAVALATDNNPGSSRTENIVLMAQMAVTRMGLTPSEAWQGITINAAKATNKADSVGAIAPGLFADLIMFDVSDFRTLLYHFGTNHAAVVVVGGQVVEGKENL